jgi:hypothetical protein
MPGPFAPPSGMYPALYLYPLNDSFVPKHIALPAGQRIKIGRQTNAKTVPAERNGFFDSKVLSRQHAEVWEEGAKVCITVVHFFGSGPSATCSCAFMLGNELEPSMVVHGPGMDVCVV